MSASCTLTPARTLLRALGSDSPGFARARAPSLRQRGPMGNAPNQRYSEKAKHRTSISLGSLPPAQQPYPPTSSDSPTSSASPTGDPFHPNNFQKGPFRRPSLTSQTEPAVRVSRTLSHRRTNSDNAQPRPGLPERISIGGSDRQRMATDLPQGSNLTLDTSSSTALDHEGSQQQQQRRREDSFGTDRFSDSASDGSGRTSTRVEQRALMEVSMILPWLYLGGDVVAKSKDKLRENGITHVLNAARTVCDNYHEGDSGAFFSPTRRACNQRN